MLKHSHATPVNPARVILLGGSGFVGLAINDLCSAEGIPVRSFSSKELDLTADGSADKLAAELKPDDAVVILSALTPDKGRDIATFMRNLRMVENICAAFRSVKPAHVVYFSSDAVYPMTGQPVNEESAAEPVDMYAAMHISRELMLKATVGDILCVLRPTLIYGATDTHNSYGPNRFRRQAAKEGKIVIGGNGEETRDHVYVGDVAKLTGLVLKQASRGTLNVATGRSADFGSVARLVAARFGGTVQVCPTERNNAITHRSFDVTACHKAFPGFLWLRLEDGIAMVHEATK